jgi:hypothetical protein
MPTMKEVLKELKEKNYSDEKFSKWLINPNVRKIYSMDNLEEIKNLWYEPKKKVTPTKTTIKKKKD